MSNLTFANNRAISASYVNVMADLVEKHGGKRDVIIRKAGISRHTENDFFSFITLRQYEALLRESLQTTQDPALGLYLGKAIKFSDHGTFAFSALSFSTVWEALKVGKKFAMLSNQIIDLKLEEQTHFKVVRVDTAYFSDALYQTVIEMVLSLMCEILRFMLNEDISSLQVDFSFGAPSYAEQYRDVFESTVNFEASANEIRIPRKLADRPLVMANPDVARKFEEECDVLIAKLNEPKSVPQQVHEALFLSRGGFPSLDDIADQVNLSSRTLRRRLSESGTSYKKILDDVRLELSHRYLTTTRLSIGEIAERLGYTDQNSFSYAYKQLTGMPPTSYRQQHSSQT